MQRALAYALSPAPRVPLRFLLTAPWFALLAALVLLWFDADAFASRWSSALLGATHLLTLGYLSMAMAGSMLQLIPVVTGTALAPGRLSAGASWAALVLGALMLSLALTLNLAALFLPSALLLAGAFVLLAVPIARALAAPASAGAMPMVRGMRMALAALVVTGSLGLALASHFAALATMPVLLLADLHAAWGLVGWVGLLIVCVAFQVIPMFQGTQIYSPVVTRWAVWLLIGSLAAWSAVWIGMPHYARGAGFPLAASLAGFAALSAWLLATRRRKSVDATTLYWRLSFASLAASALLYLVADDVALFIGVLFVGGFAMGAVNGMLYKIVPFLLWYHMQQDGRAKKGDVPALRTIIADTCARRQFWCHCAALVLLLGAVQWPHLLVRPAAALLAIASLCLALDLLRAAIRYRGL